MISSRRRKVAVFLLLVSSMAGALRAQGPANVLVVINDNSSLSRDIGEYYARRRQVPMSNVCRLRTTTNENIPREDYNREIAGPLAQFLRTNRLTESILYIVITQGVPLRIPTITGKDMGVDGAAVDSELALLYSDMHSGRPHPIAGSLPNPFFGKKDAKFTHPQFPVYLVTRLAAYDFDGVKGLIDRALQASNRGKFVIDLRDAGDEAGNDWLLDAALLLPKERTVVDQSERVLYNQTDVIGFASWGSNDKHRHQRFLRFHWLPGAIMTEYVSTNARTFARPPDNWQIGTWGDKSTWFDGSPQTMTADYILEGVTGASGNVDEPYLMMNPRPDFLLPAYYHGRNLAESYYLSMRGLSWQEIVVGDPLCSLGSPSH
ncbi:MAG TPA: TIGR03790 family protein [Bryobacteraceae bacterium]|nr:TIGR03790 family protein [Bryobacteraceae bacterium]